MHISKKTAQRMLQNIEMKLQALASEQQSMNGNKGSKQMGKGGRVKMSGTGPQGGLVPYNRTYFDPILNNAFKPVNQANPLGKITYPFENGAMGFTPYMLGSTSVRNNNISSTANLGGPMQGSTQFRGASVPPTAVSDENLNSFKVSTDKLTMPTFANPVDKRTLVGGNIPTLDNTGTSANWNNMLGLAPTIFNTVAGMTLGRADKLNPNEFQNPYESQSFSMMPDQFRIDDILNENKNAYGSFLKNINSVGNSRGERMANYTSGMNRMNEANTKAYALKNNMENEMRTNKAQLRNYQGVLRGQTNLRVRDMNDANAAATRNARMGYLGSAATGLQTYNLTNKQMANQMASQQAYIDALKNFPHFAEWLGLDKLKVKGQ